MNDRHPSGTSFPIDPVANSSYSTYGGTYDASYEEVTYGAYGPQDIQHPLSAEEFDIPGAAYGDGAHSAGPAPVDASGPWDGGLYGDVSYGTGQWDTTAWAPAAVPPEGGWDEGAAYGGWGSGHTPQAYDGWDGGAYGTAAGDGPPEGTGDTAVWEPGAYTTAEAEVPHPVAEHGQGAAPQERPGDGAEDVSPGAFDLTPPPEDDPGPGPGPATARRPVGQRGRRRSAGTGAKPKRSALVAVAVPSACVMGVTAVAAASVGIGEDDAASRAAAAPVQPSAANSKLDAQITSLSADARSFAGRASRVQERIDLKARQEAERKRRAAEAARREALRPKFALPVQQQGLSAYYGQAGLNWMSLHTGIDFPVSYGTPVMAATDGVVTTRWDSAYGNMAIVTAPDGTQTWYCHLSSTKIRSGYVKAGDTIAYSGNSGNSTGPHLHFEVRPGGGSPIDPLTWFRSKGLDPT